MSRKNSLIHSPHNMNKDPDNSPNRGSKTPRCTYAGQLEAETAEAEGSTLVLVMSVVGAVATGTVGASVCCWLVMVTPLVLSAVDSGT